MGVKDRAFRVEIDVALIDLETGERYGAFYAESKTSVECDEDGKPDIVSALAGMATIVQDHTWEEGDDDSEY